MAERRRLPVHRSAPIQSLAPRPGRKGDAWAPGQCSPTQPSDNALRRVRPAADGASSERELRVERRRHGTGQVTHVGCRSCASPVLLDPSVMSAGSAGPELRCAACGAPVPVRHGDPERVAPTVTSALTVASAPIEDVPTRPALQATPEPGWYPNPDGSGGMRYFDGRAWTDRVGALAPGTSAGPASAGPASAGPASAGPASAGPASAGPAAASAPRDAGCGGAPSVPPCGRSAGCRSDTAALACRRDPRHRAADRPADRDRHRVRRQARAGPVHRARRTGDVGILPGGAGHAGEQAFCLSGVRRHIGAHPVTNAASRLCDERSR